MLLLSSLAAPGANCAALDKVFEAIDDYISALRKADPELKPPAVITISLKQAKLMEAWATDRKQDKVGLGGPFKDMVVSYRGIRVTVPGR